jgi:hypothetical protein
MQRLALAAAAWLALESAWAHGLGQRYDLPIPLSVYLLGAAAAVAASFAFLALFRGSARHTALPAHRMQTGGRIPFGVAIIFEAAAIAMFLFMIVAGLFGNQSTFKNFAPTAFWVLWWVGFTFVCAFACNLWPLVNPPAILFRWSDALWRRWTSTGLSRNFRYPRQLGAWPAVALFLMFAWTELVAPHRDVPRNIALAMLLYAALFWVGSFLFGDRLWLRSGDAFAVAFGLFGRFAPLQLIKSGRVWRWRLRPYAVGLLSARALSIPMIVFTLAVLASVTVDGFLETPAWVAAADVLASILPSGSIAALLPPTLLLIVGPIVFAATYGTVIVVMARVMGQPRSSWIPLAGRFVLSLVPIAIAYHLAHYLSFLLLAGQLIIPLASDPFGFGWDLFSTTLYRLDIGIIDARFVWLTSVVSIVLGHIIATWLAHETALSIFETSARARRSQYPMLCLMIAYTVTSLWILAQPIVETRPA